MKKRVQWQFWNVSNLANKRTHSPKMNEKVSCAEMKQGCHTNSKSKFQEIPGDSMRFWQLFPGEITTKYT